MSLGNFKISTKVFALLGMLSVITVIVTVTGILSLK